MTDHALFMDMALALGARGLGTTWPNPSVGCVIVKDGCVVGRGVTRPGGRPHAETEALAAAGDAARGATLYVTLEPCAHTGVTPPCTEAIARAGIARVVIACEDPDPRTAGEGIAGLKHAGIEVVCGVREAQAHAQHAGFLSRVLKGRPCVTMKLATSLDGRIATRKGESLWITGEAARAHGHSLRATHDAVLTGIGTALSDNPQMTCRLPGQPSPLRIVVDSSARLPLDSHLADVALAPTWVMCLDAPDTQPARDALEARGVRCLPLPDLTVPTQLTTLAAHGLTRLLVEAGPRVTTAFLLSDTVDQLHWYRAPVLIGGDGQGVTSSLEVSALEQSQRFRRREIHEIGEDVLEIYEKHA